MRLFGFGKIIKKDNGCKINRFVMIKEYHGYTIEDNKKDRNIIRINTGNNELDKKIGQFALEEIEKYYCPNHE